MDKCKVDLVDDKFFIGLNPEQQQEALRRLKENDCNPSYIGGKWHGEIKFCPSCKKVRFTTCCACGCGECMTCHYRFTCYPPTPITLAQPIMFYSANPVVTTDELLKAIQSVGKSAETICVSLDELISVIRKN